MSGCSINEINIASAILLTSESLQHNTNMMISHLPSILSHVCNYIITAMISFTMLVFLQVKHLPFQRRRRYGPACGDTFSNFYAPSKRALQTLAAAGRVQPLHGWEIECDACG